MGALVRTDCESCGLPPFTPDMFGASLGGLGFRASTVGGHCQQTGPKTGAKYLDTGTVGSLMHEYATSQSNPISNGTLGKTPTVDIPISKQTQ